MSARRTPRGIWALRAVTLTIALIAILVIGTVVFSAYEDYSAVKPEITGGSSHPIGSMTQDGNTAVVSINFTVPNRGVYTLNVAVTCGSNSNPVVTCTEGRVSVPAGGQDVLRFKMTITDLKAYLASSDRRINGTVSMGLEPFVNLSVVTDLSGLVKVGGS